jgi:alkylation response protein AidB-like acyl-CoA dehydrogenase
MEANAYKTYRETLFRRLWDDIWPHSAEIEEREQIPKDQLYPLLAEMGVWGLLVPEAFGGKGMTVRQYMPVISEISKIHGGLRAVIHVHNSMAHALSHLAGREQQAAVLPRIATGEMSAAFALTEPDFGTGADVGTQAVRDGDEFVIDGRKWLITNSDFASHFILITRTAPRGEKHAHTAFLVERDTPGLTIERLPETMGCKGGEHGLLTFVNARIPASCMIGEEGTGLVKMEETLEISRVLVAASSLGTAERAYELSLEHAHRRVTFGKPLAKRQAIQRYLAEMATDIYALRLMLIDCGERWDSGERIPAQASMTKLFGLEAVGRVTDRALLIFGGIGYTQAHEIERLYRDARLNWLEEGTPTIQQTVIAREYLADRVRDEW